VTYHIQKRPIYKQKRRINIQKRPIYIQKRPINKQKRPFFILKRCSACKQMTFYDKWPSYKLSTYKRSNYTHELLKGTHCNTLQHTATHCNTLQHAATHCNILQKLLLTTHVSCSRKKMHQQKSNAIQFSKNGTHVLEAREIRTRPIARPFNFSKLAKPFQFLVIYMYICIHIPVQRTHAPPKENGKYLPK